MASFVDRVDNGAGEERGEDVSETGCQHGLWMLISRCVHYHDQHDDRGLHNVPEELHSPALLKATP